MDFLEDDGFPFGGTLLFSMFLGAKGNSSNIPPWASWSQATPGFKDTRLLVKENFLQSFIERIHILSWTKNWKKTQ